MVLRMKDPVSAMTHMLGALLAIPVTALLVVRAALYASVWHIVSFSVFGVSLLLQYTASSVYHSYSISEKVSLVLRRIDHMMIFVLIAGTYTPVCLIALRGPWGWTLFGLVWGLAVAGIVIKSMCSFQNRILRWLSTILYVCMGWIVVIAFLPLVRAIPSAAFAMLVLGGVSYTLGAVIYALKRPRLHFKYFGHHEIFHLFVLAGSAFHVIFMFMI